MLMRAGVDLGGLRAREFARLDATSCAYLDYAGAALYPRSLIVRDARRLATSVMGNPHSESEPSRSSAATRCRCSAATTSVAGRFSMCPFRIAGHASLVFGAACAIRR